MEENKKTRVCLFIRVSSDKQNEERQVKELNDYCSARGYFIVDTIKNTISGKREAAKRPDIKELRAKASNKEFDKVIVTELSRLGRRAHDIRDTINHLHQNNICVLFKNLGIESLDENGKESFVTNIIISIYAELAQEEIRILAERTRSGLRLAVSKGKKLGRKEGMRFNTGKILSQYPELILDIDSGKSLNECVKNGKITEANNLSKNTVIKVKRILKSLKLSRYSFWLYWAENNKKQKS